MELLRYELSLLVRNKLSVNPCDYAETQQFGQGVGHLKLGVTDC
jgi:hypothetical protein